MNRFSVIVISAAAVLLLTGALWQQRALGQLRAEHEELSNQARARGIPPAGETAPTRKAARRDPLAEAWALAEDLIRRALDGGVHQSDWAAQAALSERVRVLNPAQLRVMIDAIAAAEELPGELRSELTFHFLGRLAEDFPEEVIARLEKDLHRETNYRFGEVFSAALIRFAERDPEAAWARFHELPLDAGNRWFQPMQYALLTGIGRADPTLALRRAEEAGIEGTDFLRQGERTIDQQLATLTALRAWSTDDPARQAQLLEHIQAETLKPTHHDPNRFDVVTGWIKEAQLPLDEIGFLADAGKLDLCHYIDPRETGKWIEWLCRTFPEEQIGHRLQRLFEDYRTKDEAQAWLKGLPADEAAEIERRLTGK